MALDGSLREPVALAARSYVLGAKHELGSDPGADTLQKAIAHAQAEMTTRRADFAWIVDRGGAEAWSGRNDAQGTKGEKRLAEPNGWSAAEALRRHL